MSYASSSRDHSPVPLLQEHRTSVSLQTLSPRASPSPPPSFYHDLANRNNSKTNNSTTNHTSSYAIPAQRSSISSSSSPSRARDRSARRIQFAAPPPPIASSVFLSPQGSGSGANTPRSISRSTTKNTNGRARSSDSRYGAPLPGLGSRRGSGIGIATMDPLLVLERRERAIQSELQELLDAQSAGLVQGFGASGEREGGGDGSEGSSTPTRSSLKSSGRGRDGSVRVGGVVPVRQPKRKVLSLRGARRALLRDMGELVGVKVEEAAVLDAEISRRNVVLERVAEWESKIENVRKQLNAHSNSDSGNEQDEEAIAIKGLRNEEKAVDSEIRELEDRLAGLHARKRWLGERIAEGVNRRDAQMSSYRGALREVEKEVRVFLARPPVGRSVVMRDEEEGFVEMKVERRTLGMAREWWEKEVGVLGKRREEVQREKAALEDGAGIWEGVVESVVGFEDALRREMSVVGAGVGDKKVLATQIEGMGEVIKILEAIMGIVEEKGWNLLICAVGAELEAFKEGEGILKSALGMVEDTTFKNGESVANGQGRREEHDDDTDSILNELNTGAALDGSREIKARGIRERERTSFGSTSASDEGPNLQELMVEEERA